MFTGIVEEIGTILKVNAGAKSSTLTIAADHILVDVKSGDSIAVNGICLTITNFAAGSFTVDAMPETFRRTNLGLLRAGSKVNLERALQLSGRLGGHLVSGHIDGTGRISRMWREENAIWISVSAEPSLLKYMIDRGSVALDGVSLTTTAIDHGEFSVSIIPHTQKETILTEKKPGDVVNIECDLVAKYIERLVSPHHTGGKIDLDFLRNNNFL